MFRTDVIAAEIPCPAGETAASRNEARFFPTVGSDENRADYEIESRLGGGVRRAALAAEHRQGMIKRGNIEHAIEVSARQHFVNEGFRVHELQMNVVVPGPAVQ